MKKYLFGWEERKRENVRRVSVSIYVTTGGDSLLHGKQDEDSAKDEGVESPVNSLDATTGARPMDF